VCPDSIADLQAACNSKNYSLSNSANNAVIRLPGNAIASKNAASGRAPAKDDGPRFRHHQHCNPNWQIP
jgi:hypothetical protein